MGYFTTFYSIHDFVTHTTVLAQHVSDGDPSRLPSPFVMMKDAACAAAPFDLL